MGRREKFTQQIHHPWLGDDDVSHIQAQQQHKAQHHHIHWIASTSFSECCNNFIWHDSKSSCEKELTRACRRVVSLGRKSMLAHNTHDHDGVICVEKKPQIYKFTHRSYVNIIYERAAALRWKLIEQLEQLNSSCAKLIFHFHNTCDKSDCCWLGRWVCGALWKYLGNGLLPAESVKNW